MQNKNDIADICLVVEGSYPYVRGGVASWIHQILENYSDLTFNLVVLVSSDQTPLNPKYDLPKNVKNIYNLPIRTKVNVPIFSKKKMKHFNIFKEFFDSFFSFESFEKLTKSISKLSKKEKTTLLQEALYSEEIFDYINNFYESSKEFRTKAYIDFFWSLRSIYFSFLNVLLYDIPKAKVYHTISTGYAGLFASLCKIKYPQSRLLITEHGIYTRERKMDITIADWADRDYDAYDPRNNISLYKNMWEDSFELVSKITYQYSNEIISLNYKNNQIQINEGADEEKVYFVRNGINLNRFTFKERKAVDKNNIKIGFLGRVVKIKDVKTFIKAADILSNTYENIEFLIAGPTDEDEEYFENCKSLVSVLSLENKLKFIGTVKSEEFLQEIDILVLTSLSEGQPLVIGEANACGVPCVVTDVGGSAEMILGGAEDTIGPSGVLTRSVNPSETAEGIEELIENPTFYNECSINGQKRVLSFYDEKIFLQRYKEIYENNIAKSEIK